MKKPIATNQNPIAKVQNPIAKLLIRKAKDDDLEAVEELIEEIIGEETPVDIEVPENHEVTIDEEAFAGFGEKLDALIDLQRQILAQLQHGGTGAEDADPEENAEEELTEMIEEELRMKKQQLHT